MGYTEDIANLEVFSKEMSENKAKKCTNLGLDQDNVDQGLAKLVLTVIELLRKLMENQAMRRIENGTVTDDETERMGETFIKLDEKMIELREIFNLEEGDLNIDLGPLGKLL
jgi:hypothetical protein